MVVEREPDTTGVDIEIRNLPNRVNPALGVMLGPPRYSGRQSATFRRYSDGRWVFAEIYILEMDTLSRPNIVAR
jgi:hypothetical protein